MYLAGLSLSDSLNIISNETKNHTLKNLICDLLTTLSEGLPLSSALEKHPHHFNQFICHLIRAGETSGQLDRLLPQIISYRERIQQIKQKLVNALIYPICIIIMAGLVIYLFLVFIVPQFTHFFSGLNAPLPWITQQVIQLANFLSDKGLSILLILILSFSTGFFFKKLNRHFKIFSDKVLWNTPFIGKLIQMNAIIRFTKILSLMHAAGVPLVETLQALHHLISYYPFQITLKKIMQQIKQGQTLSQSIKVTHCFPHLVTQMITVGEESGKISDMLSKTAYLYETELEQFINRSMQLIEPFLIFILGAMISLIVIAIYLPILQLGTLI
jgi:type IV pilus assembly protein PilC